VVRLQPPDPPLAGNGIALRQFAGSDVAWIAAAFGDGEIGRYVPAIPDPYTEADAAAFVEYARAAWADGTSAPFVIVRSSDGAGLGGIELHLFPRDATLAEAGYWLARTARGRGTATTALRLIASWAFSALGILRLQVTTAPDNVASQRVAERAGFSREGLLRSWLPAADGRRDSLMYSLLRDDV
jgi:RimJ/RimL family protein N-acetyltransferase